MGATPDRTRPSQRSSILTIRRRVRTSKIGSYTTPKTRANIERCIQSMEYTRTVPRHLVHRHAVAEVFLTDYRIESDSAYQVAVQLPVSHRIFDVSSEQHDPLGVAEAFRQAVVLLCHTRYEIPLHYKFLMETFSFEMLDALDVQPVAEPLSFSMTADNLTHRDGCGLGGRSVGDPQRGQPARRQMQSCCARSQPRGIPSNPARTRRPPPEPAHPAFRNRGGRIGASRTPNRWRCAHQH